MALVLRVEVVNLEDVIFRIDAAPCLRIGAIFALGWKAVSSLVVRAGEWFSAIPGAYFAQKLTLLGTARIARHYSH